MNKKQAIVLLLVLFVGWGGAFLIAHLTGQRGLATVVFLATIAVFCYWPLRRRGK